MGSSPGEFANSVEAGTSIIGGAAGAAAGFGSAFGGATAAATIGGVAAATAGIGAAVAGIVMLAETLFKGCGQGCIDSAEIEQVYEATGDNIYEAESHGWITSAEAVAAMNAMIQAGQSAYAKYPQLGSHGTAGLRNMTNTLDSEIQSALQIPGGTSSLPADYASVFIQPGAKGWYSTSLQSAFTLSESIIQQIIAARSPVSSVPVLGNIVSQASAATGVKGSWLVIGAIGLILAKVGHLI